MISPSPNANATPQMTPETGAAESAMPSAGQKDAVELLKADHREVEQLFKQFESGTGRQQRKKLIEKIAAALTAHTMIEEEIFYPACREKGVEHDDLDEAQVEHDTVKLLVADLLKSSQDDDYFEAKVTVLSEYVKHHVGEEEDPSDGIFASAKKAELDMDELGRKLQARKDELMKDEKRLIGRPQKIRSLNLSQLNQEYGDMARYPTDRYREEQNGGHGYRASNNGQRGSEYRGFDYDDDNRGSSLSRGSRSELYRGGYDEDFGPNRGAYGESDHDRSARGYPDDNRSSGYRGGMGNSERGYSENTNSSYGHAYARPGQPGTRPIEQSASGGRYRQEYAQGDMYSRPGAGRQAGGVSDDHEYYQGTRYGSTYGGGRTEGYDSQDQGRDDRYYSGQGHGSTRGGDFGGRSAYGPSNEWEQDQGRHDLSGRDDIARRDFANRDDNNGRGGNGDRGGNYRPGSGFRGNR